MNNARRQSARFPQRHRRGAVLLIVLVAITLLVGLMFFVFNLGSQVSRREELQNSADAVATGGAGWLARSMNTIAMNNVGQAKMISSAFVLDAIPLAAELAIKELQVDTLTDDSLAKGLERQIERGLPDTRREQGCARSASYATVCADAILILPATETPFGPLWPGDVNAEFPQYDYPSVQARIQAAGTILDESQRQGTWSQSAAVNEYRSRSYETLDPAATAEWTTRLASTDGRFRVYAWWSSDTDGSHRYSSATYTLTTAGGEVASVVDQNRNSGAWIDLGEYTFPVTQGDAEIRVRLQGPPNDANRSQSLTNFLQNGLRKLAREMAPSDDDNDATQYDELILLDDALNSTDEREPEDGAYDVTRDTHWDTGGQRGNCWAAALAMRDLSNATAQKAGLLAQVNAQQFGRDNGADTSFLTPAKPDLLCKEGTYDDFTPVLTGLFRVRLREPQQASLDLPIHTEITRVNNLDDSLDELSLVFSDLQQNLTDIDSAQNMLSGATNWTTFEQLLQTIRSRVEEIESRRLAIGNRLDVMDRLGAMGGGIELALQKIDQILAEVGDQKRKALLSQWLDELTQRHQNSVGDSGLMELAVVEEQLEIADKEDRLANLHQRCPGGGIPDYVASPFYRLGPYATLHQWRYPWYENSNQPGWVGDPEVGPGWGYDTILGYTTYGPYRWSLDEVTRSFGMVGSHSGSLDVSRFAYYVQLGANIKLAYTYGLTHTQHIRYATRWITDYTAAQAFAANPDNRRKIIRTRYYRPVVMSSLRWDNENWLKDRSTYWSHMGAWETYWTGNGLSPLDNPPAALWVWEPSGWYDLATQRPQAQKLNNYTWRWDRSYDDVTYEHRVGLNERRSATTNNAYIPWTIYLTSWYVFGGIQVAEEVTVSNPCNWPDDEDDKPYPLLMDFSQGDYVENHDEGVRRSHFTFLGTAAESGSAAVWNQKFVSGAPGGQITAVAQAEVFNNLSWDLWTQNWREQLVPVTGWEDWQQRLAEGLDVLPELETQAGNVEWNDTESIRNVVEILQRIDPSLVQVFMNH